MEEIDAEIGVEVTHPQYGRGVITEFMPNFGSNPDIITVRFYNKADSQNLPVDTIQPAHKVASAHVKTGRFGFTIVADDGFGIFTISPDGTGDGYIIEYKVNGELMDQATILSTES